MNKSDCKFLESVMAKLSVVVEHYTIMREFIARIAVQSKDLEPHYGELISKHFWELV